MTRLNLFVFTSLVMATARTAAFGSPLQKTTFQTRSNQRLSKSEVASTPLTNVRGGSINRIRFGRLDKFVDKLFDSADTDGNGRITMKEAYELVLLLYVKINRQAPIPPPSREKVLTFFEEADVSRTGWLSRDEFHTLALTLAKRASTRLLAHKTVTLIAAPILALQSVQALKGSVDFLKNSAILERLPPDSSKLLKSANTWKTALTVLFVSTLGNIVVRIVTLVLDWKEKKKEEVEQTGEAKS